MKSKRVAPLPPGPKPWPIVGNLPELFKNKPRYKWLHRLMKEFNTEIACIRLGRVHVIPVASPEISMEFLKKYDAVFASRPITVTTNMFSNGFLTAGVSPWGDQWKKMRRVLTSEILSPARLKWLLAKRNEEADNLVRVIYNMCKGSAISDTCSTSGTVVDVRTVSQHFTGNVMRRMIFNKRYYGKGREDGGPCFEEQEHIQALFAMLLYVYAFCVSDYMSILKPFDLDGHEKVVRNALKVIKKYEDPIVDERVQMWKEGKRTEPEDLLDIFISIKDDDGNPLLSTEEIKAQITELLLATVDNPSNAAEWALAEMLNQPEQIQKAVEEIDRVVGKERLVQESDLPKLPYVTACAREALRIHPIAPFNLPHVSTAEVTVAGYFIPKGSQVLLSRLGLGRNPRVWEEPLRFDPERHLKDNLCELGLAEPELRFITFTRGRRGCMGGTLGTLITLMLLARLLQGFKWSIPPNNNMEKIDLTENDQLFLAEPLQAYAEPRLPPHLYQP
ncbi:hypothetical protein I3843_13G154200 [Carya illinoinensis]|uniref:Cytochrome P450 n=1 Tax=Carya illinoinensis TaxID=32201 RepID=A0A922DEU5_CARIL|nr:hypothetical protein I3842_13G176100 [Carya illinoinensis]KAG7951195.1 hypothetical protein I3843_13G154200 [Carya illinoinensis]